MLFVFNYQNSQIDFQITLDIIYCFYLKSAEIDIGAMTNVKWMLKKEFFQLKAYEQINNTQKQWHNNYINQDHGGFKMYKIYNDKRV